MEKSLNIVYGVTYTVLIILTYYLINQAYDVFLYKKPDLYTSLLNGKTSNSDIEENAPFFKKYRQQMMVTIGFICIALGLWLSNVQNDKLFESISVAGLMLILVNIITYWYSYKDTTKLALTFVSVVCLFVGATKLIK
jgi:hypothetical protein